MTPEPTASHFYASMLECSHAQAAAVEQDDWGAFERLMAQRHELLQAGEHALARGSLPEATEAADLIRAVLTADSAMGQLLATKREQLCQELARFRHAVAAAACYRARQPAIPPGHLYDGHL